MNKAAEDSNFNFLTLVPDIWGKKKRKKPSADI